MWVKNNDWVNLRTISYHVNMKLTHKSEVHSFGNLTGCKCLIADDTDMPRAGWSIELIDRKWSHVNNRNMIGFKGLFLGYHDGKSFYRHDFSIHGEN